MDFGEVIPNYLQDNFGGLNVLLRCNYDKHFLADIHILAIHYEKTQALCTVSIIRTGFEFCGCYNLI